MGLEMMEGRAYSALIGLYCPSSQYNSPEVAMNSSISGEEISNLVFYLPVISTSSIESSADTNGAMKRPP